MSSENNSQQVAPREMPRHPVISFGDAAKRLQCSKSHLNRVVRGARPNARRCAAARSDLELRVREQRGSE